MSLPNGSLSFSEVALDKKLVIFFPGVCLTRKSNSCVLRNHRLILASVRQKWVLSFSRLLPALRAHQPSFLSQKNGGFHSRHSRQVHKVRALCKTNKLSHLNSFPSPTLSIIKPSAIQNTTHSKHKSSLTNFIFFKLQRPISCADSDPSKQQTLVTST